MGGGRVVIVVISASIYLYMHTRTCRPIPTLVGGVGVDFIFPCHDNKNVKNKSPQLTSNRGKGPTCSKLWEYFIDV